MPSSLSLRAAVFLSTPSARRATKSLSPPPPLPNNFYPRPPRGGRRRGCGGLPLLCIFLSTPSARRATGGLAFAAINDKISIHALREEGDALSFVRFPSWPNFYPRPPRGGRRKRLERHLRASKFLSTPSARRATYRLARLAKFDEFLSTPSARRATDNIAVFLETLRISIHALREEGDVLAAVSGLDVLDFYPRPPRGGRPPGVRNCSPGNAISIHALREEGDGCFFSWRRCPTISIHALREEGDVLQYAKFKVASNFYPRPPRGGRRPPPPPL